MLILEKFQKVSAYIRRRKTEFILAIIYIILSKFSFLPDQIHNLIFIPLIIPYLLLVGVYCSMPTVLERLFMHTCNDLGFPTFLGLLPIYFGIVLLFLGIGELIRKIFIKKADTFNKR